MPGYLVRHKDGRYIARCLHDYGLAGNTPYRWTIHKSRAHSFRTRELAATLVAIAIDDDPDCQAEVIEEHVAPPIRCRPCQDKPVGGCTECAKLSKGTP